jgi:hypothetical protein
MSSSPASRVRAASVILGLVCAVAACDNPARVKRAPQLSASDAVEAEVVFSRATPRPGDEVLVLVRVRTGADVPAPASFTARLRYEADRLRLEGAYELSDGALRVMNPGAGEVRLAGIAQQGFPEGRLTALRFTALAPNPSYGVQLAFEELHATNRDDLRRLLSATRQTVDGSLLR